MTPDDMLYRVVAPHFVAGFTVAQDGDVTATAPIIAWMRGKPLGYIQRYCAGKGWGLEAVSSSNQPSEGPHDPNQESNNPVPR